MANITHIRHPPPLSLQFLYPAEVAGAVAEAGDYKVFPSPELICHLASKPDVDCLEECPIASTDKIVKRIMEPHNKQKADAA